MPVFKISVSGFVLAFLMILAGHAFAQKKANIFIHSYGNAVNDAGGAVVALPDKGYITAGMSGTKKGAFLTDNILIIRTDSFGSVLWSKIYESQVYKNSNDLQTFYQSVDLAIAPDGNIVVATDNAFGQIGFGQGKGYLFKIDLSGNVLWSRSYFAKGLYDSSSNFQSVINDRKDGFLLAGIGDSVIGFKTGRILKSFPYLLKANSDGTFGWAKIYLDSNTLVYNTFIMESVIPSRSGGYIVGGHVYRTYTSSGTAYFDYMVMKIDRDGNIVWSKSYGSGNLEMVNSVIELPDKSIYAFGYYTGDSTVKYTYGGTLQKLDSNGNLKWSKMYYFKNSAHNGYLIDEPVFGMALYDSAKNRIHVLLQNINGSSGIMRMDTSGSILFARIFHDVSYKTSYELMHNFIRLPSGGFALTGSTNKYTAGAYDMVLIQTDSALNTNSCLTDTVKPISIAYPVKNLYKKIYTRDIGFTIDSGCTASNHAIKDSSICLLMVARFKDTKGCAGQKTPFTDSSYFKPNKWNWDFGDPTSLYDTSTARNPTHIYKNPGVYTVKLVVGNGTELDSFSRKITVYPLTKPYLFDTLICAGATIKLRESGGIAYLWQPGKSVSDSTAKTVIVSPLHTTQYIAANTNSNGCPNSDSFLVVVDNKPGPARILNTSVKNYGEIDILFQKSDSDDVKTYTILRSTDGGLYSDIGTVKNTSNSNNTYSFSDKSVAAETHHYSYKIAATDSCGASVDTSEANMPVLLKGAPGELHSLLNWTKYYGNIYDILILQRYDTITHTWTNLARLNNTDSGYIDSTYLKCGQPAWYRTETALKDGEISYSDSVMVIPYETGYKDEPRIITVTKLSTSISNGAVIIRWAKSNIHTLYSQLYYSKNGSGFKILKDSLPASLDSFVQTGINTQTADGYYYLVSLDSCPAKSPKSIIHKTITLTVTVGQLLHKLNWTPYQGYKIRIYKIEKLIAGNFQVIDSVPGTDTFSKFFPAPCNSVQRYRIEAVGFNPGEISFSDSMGRRALDTVLSDPAVIKNASVINGTTVKVDFNASDSLDTYDFIIQRAIDGNWTMASDILFTSPGQNISFTDNQVNTLNNHICYTIITRDSCLNATLSDTFCVMQLHGSGGNLAGELHWNPFKGYKIGTYNILRYNVKGVWDTVGMVTGKDTVYKDMPIPCNMPQIYKIEGVKDNGTYFTLSDSVTLTPFDTVKPPAPVLHYVTVQNDQSVKLNWQWNPKSDVKFFEVWRTTNNDSAKFITTVVYDSEYVDKPPDLKTDVYSYHIIAVDSCNMLNRSQPSHWDTLMSLKLRGLFCTHQVQLSWTPYRGLPNGVKEYEIYRSVDGINFAPIASLKGASSTFIDTGVIIGQQYFYKIRAIDTKTGYGSFSDTLGAVPHIIPEADSAQLVYATVRKTDPTAGQIYVVWKRAALADTNARGYYVYSFDTAIGKYTLLKDQPDLDDTSYTDTNINTLDYSFKYYIITYNICNTGTGSGIHKPVLLKIVNGNLSAKLNWSNYLGQKVKNYSVYKSEDGGKPVLLKDVGLDSTFTDSNINCGHSYIYQVQAILENGKISFSDSVTIKAQDTIKPGTGPIYHISVIQTGINSGIISMRWIQAKDKNLAGYNIQRSTDGLNWQTIANGYNSSTWIDNGMDTYEQPYYYRIQPVDSCGNLGSYSQISESIHLKASAGDQFALLQWNAYQGWKVKKFEVWRGNTLLASVGRDTLSFKDTSTICGNTYQYRIIASSDSTIDTLFSNSNTDSVKAFDNIQPQKVYIKTVTVSNPNKSATITWAPSTSVDAKNYYIYRKSGPDGSMTLVDSTNQLTYTDSLIHLENQITQNNHANHSSDCYYVFAHDQCGNISPGSNEGCIIILNAQNQPGFNDLNWNQYKTWYDGIQSYNVYKNEDNQGWNMIGTTSSGNINQFTDKNLGDTTINFCYQVEAVENPGKYNQLSRSTVACVHQDATVFIPNTFSHYQLDGLNDKFAPKGLYIKSYTMKIYNRWGELVYDGRSVPGGNGSGPAQGQAGNDGNGGWDGTFHGQDVLEGVYIYLITIEDYNRRFTNFKGSVTIFR